jgi:hypothetical protein
MMNAGIRKSKVKLVALRLPNEMHNKTVHKSKSEDMTFSQFVCRAMRKELGVKKKRIE